MVTPEGKDFYDGGIRIWLGYKGYRPQGNRVQSRPSVGVIRFYAKQKGHALEHVS